MTRGHLRLVPPTGIPLTGPTEATRRMFGTFAAQAAELAARFARRGEVASALKALAVARTVLERMEDGDGR